MRLAIIGTCQVEAISNAIRVVNKTKIFTKFITKEVLDKEGFDPEKFDILAYQNIPFASKVVKEFGKKVVRVPMISFSGYHPNCVNVGLPGRPVLSPTNAYNSAIALYGFLKGLTPAQTVALFNSHSYQALGYFGAFERGRDYLITQGEWASLPLKELVAKWVAQGVFLYTPNHPNVGVLGDIAAALVRAIGEAVEIENPGEYMPDVLRERARWPVYSEIAARLGVPGDYVFKGAKLASLPGPPPIYNLDEYVASSFERYAKHTEEELACLELSQPGFRDLHSSGGASQRRAHPYSGLPKVQFWSSAVAEVNPSDMEPIHIFPFSLHDRMKVATAGSCFAQHIARHLSRKGLGYYVAETPPAGMAPAEADEKGYGVFSCRYANIYTTRQLIQLFDRAYGAFDPVDRAWQRKDARWVDPFRPTIEPAGFPTPEAVEEERQGHLAAVRRMFETLDVFVFTLGLTESWRSTVDGAVFPVPPGVVAAGEGPYEFVNFTVAEIMADLSAFLSRLQGVNERAKVLLTVSPVPLIATYETEHCLTATTYSKSALRAAAGETARGRNNVIYFPSYEIITGQYARGKYFEPDLRSVTSDGVDHVMRTFLRRLYGIDDGAGGSGKSPILVADLQQAAAQVVCEEELLAG